MGKYYECKKCEPPSSFKNIHHSYYVILSPLLPPKIEFHYYDQLLTIKVELTLCGDFSLPINCLMLNFNSGLGDFSDIPLHLDWVADKKETGDRIQGHHYWTEFNLDLSKSSKLKQEIACQSFDFNGTLKLNETVFNDAFMSDSFYDFCTDLNQIQLHAQVDLNNYIPIHKLSAYYLNQTWQNKWQDYSYIKDPLAFSWEKPNMCPTASFVMDRVNPIQEIKTGQIYHLYQSNLGSGGITHYFKNIEIDLTYVLNGKQIQDVLKVNNDVAIKTKPSVDLNLNIRTLFNFNTQKLEISENGVEGIYFPVACNGQMVLKMNRDGVNYRDTIPFNFNHNFYSSNNNLYKVSLTTTNNHQGYFYKLVHA